MAIPVGAIIIWSGAVGDVPAGYVVCDGTNGTPDLRDRFVPGAGEAFPAHTSGGSKQAGIGVTHTHEFTGGVEVRVHSHKSDWFDLDEVTPAPDQVFKTYSLSNQEAAHSEAHGHTARYIFGSTTITGGLWAPGVHNHDVIWPSAGIDEDAESLMPWYYALLYIMKVA